MQLFRTDRELTPSWSLVGPSLRLVKENIWPVLYLSFLPGLVVVAGLVLAGNPSSPNTVVTQIDGRTLAGIGLMIAGGIWTILTYPALVVLQLRAISGSHPSATQCFRQGLTQFFPLLILTILTAIAIFFGLLALLIPGLILIRGFYLAQFYLIDNKLKPIEALKKSFQNSKPHAGYIWGTIAVEIVISIIGSPLGKIPVLGFFLTLAIGTIYLFGPALRYGEIAKNLPAVPPLQAK